MSLPELNPQFLLDISKLLHTHDNRATHHPCYCVQKQTFQGGLDPSLCDSDELMYVYEGEALPEEYWPRITQAMNDDAEEIVFGDEEKGEDEHYTLSEIETYGFKRDWETVQVCFTEDGAKKYIEADGHNLRKYGEPRIYVESFHRNKEMIDIRDWIMSLTSPKKSL